MPWYRNRALINKCLNEMKRLELSDELLEQVLKTGMSDLFGGSAVLTHVNNGNHCTEINHKLHCDAINHGSNCSVINNTHNCAEINNWGNCSVINTL